MALSFGPFNVGNPGGLWALIALVPLILLYLIRPRPKQMNIPSLMFFYASSGSKKLTSFLKQFTRDWLFLIQLLILLALALTFAQPFTNYQHDVTASNTVIVLDVSGSSQTVEGARSRFDLAVSQARKVLGSENSIILAKDVPFIAVQDASPQEATKFLQRVKPRASGSQIGEAIILAGETLGSEGRVVVISDFINTAGQDPNIAKAVLESKGIVVDFINIASGTPKSNVGIVDLDEGNAQTTVYVKNFNAQREAVNLKVGGLVTEMDIPENSVETFTFKTPAGVTEIELLEKDALPADNQIFLSAPEGGTVKVLHVANNASSFLRNALLASGDFEVTTSEPPVIAEGDFDVIVAEHLDMNEVLPGTFEDMLKAAEEGATVVVAVQPDSAGIDYKGLLPVKLGEVVDGGFIDVDQLNRFTKNVEFGTVNEVFAAETIGRQSVIASVNDVPVVTIKRVGSGKVVYFGIPEESEFRYSPSYPIFWTELVKFVTEQQDVQNLNYRTGETLLLDEEQKIKTPSRVVQRAALVLDEAGVYELEDRVIAVNLLNELESNVNLDKPVGTKSSDYELHPVKETKEFHWTLWLLALALIGLLFEVFFVKYRGDL